MKRYKSSLYDNMARNESQAISSAFPWKLGKPREYHKVRKLANPRKPRNGKCIFMGKWETQKDSFNKWLGEFSL